MAANGAGKVTRREVYQDGVFRSELVDTDGDGTFDVAKDYDAFGQATAQRRL